MKAASLSAAGRKWAERENIKDAMIEYVPKRSGANSSTSGVWLVSGSDVARIPLGSDLNTCRSTLPIFFCFQKGTNGFVPRPPTSWCSERGISSNEVQPSVFGKLMLKKSQLIRKGDRTHARFEMFLVWQKAQLFSSLCYLWHICISCILTDLSPWASKQENIEHSCLDLRWAQWFLQTRMCRSMTT